MRVEARGVAGNLLPYPFTAELERAGASSAGRQIARDVDPRGIAEFLTSSSRTYSLRVSARAHRSTRRLMAGTAELVTVELPIDPAAVIGYEWPEPLEPILNVEPAELEEPRRRGTLLNVWAKLWSVYIGVIPAGAYVDEILEVRVDRLICRVAGAILEAIAGADELEDVPSSLHDPPAGYVHGESVKTREAHGSLQITIFEPVDDGELPLLADIDIDESRGLEHLFDVIEHHVAGSKTNAVDIQQILIAGGIDPGWRPLVA